MPNKHYNGQMAMLRREEARQDELRALRAKRPTRIEGFDPGMDAVMQAAALTGWAIALLAVLILLVVAL